jgi:diguanylate cyclase (GGDEF)-like protein
MVTPSTSYAVRTATAVTAAVVLVVAARRHRDGLGRARLLFAAALGVGAVSGVASAVYLAATGEPAATGWVGDWIYLCYAPCAALGTLALPRSAGAAGGWLRAVADGAVSVGSLWYLSKVLLADPDQVLRQLDGSERLLTVAYPLVPTFVVAVMLSALPRVERRARPFLGQAAAGIALLGVSDAAFSVVNWSGTYQPTSWIAACNQLGLMFLLGAAFTGARPACERQTDADMDVRALSGLLVVVAPYGPLALAVAAAVNEFVHGRGIPHGQLAPILVIGSSILVRHVVSTRESARLLARLAARERVARTEARTDALTGLANRTAFVDSLEAALRDPGNHPVAVALLDLNDFKDINDTQGHDTGDLVLRVAADRLRQVVPHGGVARLGGDEFAVFLPNVRDSGRGLGQDIAEAFREPVRLGHRSFLCRASVGVVLDERPPGASRQGDASHLLAHADVAMYEAKALKSTDDSPVAVLTGRARASAAATIRIREDVSLPALEQFRLEYQPLVDLQSGEIAGAEALLRWRHPEFGEIGPVTFIPLADRAGSIGLLGEFALETALTDLARWTAAGHRIAMGVNVSPRQLGDPSLTRTAVQLLTDRGLAPSQLMLEITEEAFVDDLEPVVESVAELRAAGISVAVDDFGTGYSSLRYLRRFDADVVKIDREFVAASSAEPRTDALVRSVVEMSKALNLTCIAEGIETLEQLALVRSHGCRLGQGFLLDPPMSAEAFEKLLRAGHVYPVDVSAPTATSRDTTVGTVLRLPRAN